MKSKTKTLIEAMQILSNEIHSEDGVANAAIFEASERLSEQQKRIAELRKKNAELVQFISENTPILSYLAIECTTNLNEFKSWLEIRDLEQQAKGVDHYANLTIFPSMGDGFSGVYCSGFEAALHEASCVAKSLKEQAEQLKEKL